MAHYCVYVLEMAHDEEQAKAAVRYYLDDHCGTRQGFDYGEIERQGTEISSPEKPALPLSQAINELREGLKSVGDLIVETRKQCLKYSKPSHKAFNTEAEGYQHNLLCQLLCEEWCQEMPFWNMVNEDWSLPDDPNESDGGNIWWAVPVDLHC